MTLDETSGWQDVTIPLAELATRLRFWVVVLSLIVFLPYVVVRGPGPLMSGFLREPASGWILKVGLLTLAYLASIPLHEAVHAAAMILAGVPRSAIRFGSRFREGIFYVHCETTMPVCRYRLMLAAPFIVTALVPALVGWFLPSGWLTAYAWMMALSAIGDLEMLVRMRGLPGRAVVRDHPSALGCQVRRADFRGSA